ncbi:hypothetical protein M8818_004921 [Zalaria obscura]|uniref:Uncharacterized protein n=1 Tax=Zalaria obscura TaxID=2024903 RepID=A0ACC3SBC8_9PEZI
MESQQAAYAQLSPSHDESFNTHISLGRAGKGMLVSPYTCVAAYNRDSENFVHSATLFAKSCCERPLTWKSDIDTPHIRSLIFEHMGDTGCLRALVLGAARFHALFYGTDRSGPD